MSGAFSPPPKLDDLSATSLSAIADDDLEYALSSYVAEHIEVRGGDFEAIETLPPRLLTWYVSYIVDAEVLNGGFNQLFFNPSGQYASMAPEAFDAIGAPEAKAIVTEALALLEQHAPALEAAADAGTLEAFMETYLDQPFADLDASYASKEEQWRTARLRFLRDNAGTLGDL